MYGQSSLQLSEELALDYNNQKSVTFVGIRTAKTVDLLEMKMFFDTFMKLDYLLQNRNRESMADEEALLDTYNKPDAENSYQHLGALLSKDIDKWNNDPAKRTKISQVQSDMHKAMDQFNKNMDVTLQRGQTLEEGV